MSSVRPLFVIAGIGNGTAATARLFAKSGYRVALFSRGPDYLSKLAAEINQAGGEAAAFPLNDYTTASIRSAFAFLKQVRESIDTNILVAFAFAREVLLEFTKLWSETANEGGVAGNARKRGTLIFTGATASIRGNVLTSAFSASKFGIRAFIIDGTIITDRAKSRHFSLSRVVNQDVLLDSDYIAKSYLHLVGQDMRPAHEKW
ncbi:uncharacterized protein F5147DRAFT_753378 [Suillus discolor]|uniref:Uncharacterized protein n=1 Tax=Suillus discolor TaxID=1912936 RepID=A0A9P7JTT5_9AGAM|nr:uncharacterized protein F5147DRAFT_753378 [Suillus discolor]KAG2108453.1 hypothetical protein F5147DRAFT_753378 [Suillus discolor]